MKRLDLSLHGQGQKLAIEPLAISAREADARLQANVTLSGDYPLDVLLETDLYLPNRFPALNGQRVELKLSGASHNCRSSWASADRWR